MVLLAIDKCLFMPNTHCKKNIVDLRKDPVYCKMILSLAGI